MSFHFELITPTRVVHSGDVHMVVVPGTQGEFGVLEGHAPFMAVINEGTIQIFKDANSTPEKLYIKTGVAEVNAEGLTVLSRSAEA